MSCSENRIDQIKIIFDSLENDKKFMFLIFLNNEIVTLSNLTFSIFSNFS